MRVFVSLPMGDKSVEEIRRDQISMARIAIPPGTGYEVVDTLLEVPKDCKNPGVWYIAESLKLMADADLVVIDKYWRKYNGCRVEHIVANLYDIPVVEV